jgi:glycosyltransferase involved in cell wall biosynthesis
MAPVYNALDIAVSASRGEGFANVVGEAMATGSRCVVTNVGDCAAVVGRFGYVAPPSNPLRLADAIGSALAEGACVQARHRIKKLYPLDRLIDRTKAHLINAIASRNDVRVPLRRTISDADPP